MSILNDMNEWSGGGRKKRYSETGLSSSGSILNEMNTQIFDKHQQFLEEQKRKEEQARQQLASLSYQTPKTTVKPAQPETFSQKHPILATIADHATRALFNGDGNFGPMKEIYEGMKNPKPETGLSSSGSILNEMNTQIFDKHQQFLEEQKRKEEQARQQLASLSYQTPKTTVKPAQPETFSQKHPILATIADHATRALFNGDGNFGPMKEIYEGMKNPKPENQNFLNKVGTSLRAGTGDTVKSLGNAANYLGFENAGKALKEVGEDVTKGFDTKYDKEFSASSLLDPDWYATSVSRSVPTTAGLLVAGLAGGELAGAAAGLTKLGSFGQTVVKGVSGALLGRSTESAMEAGETLEQALERGMSKEEAKKVANSTFAKNMALATTDAAQLIDLFSGGKISSKTLGKLTSNVGPKTNAAFKIGANAAIEGGEEVYQEWAQRSSLGDPFKMDSQTWEAFTIGALMGGTMGLTTAAKESYDGLKTKAVDNMPDDLRKEYDKVHEQSIKSGMDPIDARDKALDVLSQTPKGNEYVRKIFADSTRDIDQVFMKHAKSFTMNLDTETADMKRAELQSALQQAQAANDLVAVKGIEDSIVRFNVWRGLAESGVQQPPVSSQTQTMGLVTNENPTLNNEPVTKTIQPQQEFDLTGQTDINTEHIPPISETGFTFMDKPSKEKVYREIDMDNGEKLYVTVNDPENVRFMVTSPNKEGSYHTEIKLEDGRTVPINGGWSSGPRVVKYYTGLDLETKPDGSYRVKGYKNPNNLEAQPSAMQQQVKKEDTLLEGKTDSAFTPDNQEISFRYAIKDADSLITSNDINIKENPDYPQELQPRDRTREGMVQQINEIAGKLNPKLLGTSPNVSSGAPIIGPDNVVESGNGRTIALKKVYEGIPEKAAEYKRYLTENAKEFGLSAADIENMSKPVLVRVRETEVNRSDFAKKANAPETAALSATEQAIIDADKISQGLMNLFTPDNNGNINTAGNRSFITEFMNQTMSTPERTRYMTEDGALNADGLRRVQNAVFARAYGDASAIEKLAEATETNVQNTIKGMLAAAPRMAYIKQGIEDGTFFPVDISSDLTAAMNKLSELRYEGRKVDAYLDQLSMLEEELTPEGKDLLLFFDQAKSIKAVKEFLLTYAHAVESTGSPNQLGLFSQQPLTKADMLTATFRRISKNDETLQTTLFEDERESRDRNRAKDAQTRTQDRQNGTGKTAEKESQNLAEKKKEITPDNKFIEEAIDSIENLIVRQKETGKDISTNEKALQDLKSGKYSGKAVIVARDMDTLNGKIRVFETFGKNENAFYAEFADDYTNEEKQYVRKLLADVAKGAGKYVKDIRISIRKTGMNQYSASGNRIDMKYKSNSMDGEEFKRTLYHEIGHRFESKESKAKATAWEKYKRIAAKYKPKYNKKEGFINRDLPKPMQKDKYASSWTYVFDYKNSDNYVNTNDAFYKELWPEASAVYFEAVEGNREHFDLMKQAMPDLADYMETYYGKLPSKQTEKTEENRDQLVLQRVNQEPFVVKRGEYYRVYAGKKNGEKQYHIAKVIGLSQTNRTVRMIRDDSARHNGVEYDIEFIYPLTEEDQKVLSDKNKPKDAVTLSSVVDKANKKNAPEGGFSAADKVWNPEELGKLRKDTLLKIRNLDVTAQEIKDAFTVFVQNKEQTIKAIFDAMKANPKNKGKRTTTFEKAAAKSYENLLIELATVVDIGYQLPGYYIGAGSESMQNALVKGLQQNIDALTEERLQTHIEKEKATKEKTKQAIENPQTLSDFREKLRHKGELTPEEQVKYEELLALQQKEAQKEKDKKQSAVSSTVMESERFTIREGKHTKTDEKLWIVNLKDRVDSNEFKSIKAEMKKLGGYWSNYKPNNGFIFKEDPTELLGAAPVAEEKHQEISERKEQAKASKTAEKLREVADNMQKDIDAKRAERKTNTARRAAMAASAEADADAMTAQQKILRNIADAIESEKAVYLDGVTARTHIETLDHYLIRAKQNYRNVNNISYEKDSKRPVGLEDIAIFPYPKAEFHKERLIKLLDITKDTPGLKKDSRFLLNRIASKKSDYVDVTLHLDRLDNILRKAVKMGGDAKLWAENIKDSLKHYKRLQTMGITTEAQFRSALREYLTYREGTGVSKEELKKRELKRRESELARTKIDGFFPTPTPIVKDMVERADIQTGDKVLEPSAGKGNIADIIREHHPDNALDVVEYNNSLASFLEEKGHNVVGSDFLEHKGKYDKIIMNPPFEKGQDIDHVRHAYELLKPGGKIVAIMSEGPFYRSDKKATAFREWMEKVGGISEEMDGAFKQAERQTGVKTRLVEIEKPAISKTEKQTKKEKQAVETFYETKSNTEMKTPKIKQDGVSRTPDDLLSDFVDFQTMADALKNQTSDEGKTVTRIQIINHIKDAFGVSVGTGKYRQRARAIHKVAPGVIRSKNFADFVALTHELGHRLDKVYDFSGYKTLEKDLYNLAGNLQLPKSANNALRRSEGVAEFMRLYVYDQGLAKQLAPTFFEHFQETMKANDMLPAVNDLISLLQDWVTQSSSARVRGTLRSLRREKQRITKEEWYTRLYDELHPLQKAVERMTNGAKLAPEKDPFKLAWVSRGVSGKIRAFLEHGVVDENGKKVGKSLAEIFNSVDNLNAFEEYVTSLRALELHKQGKLKTPINIPDAMRVIEDGKNKYHQAATDLYAYKDAVLDELVKSGMMTEEDITTMREQNPFHVPFYRVFDDVNKSGGRGNGKNFANLQQAIKKMKDTGSSRDIINPLESVVKDTFLFLSLAERNNVARSLADLTKYDDSGQWLEKIEMPNTPVRFSLEDVEKQLEKAGVDLNEADLGAMLMVFRANNRPNSKEQVVTVWRDGKQELYQVKDPDLYQALLALDPEPFNWIVKYLSIPNNTLRTGITLSPAFTIKSALRALPAMMIQTKSYQRMEFIKDLPQNLWRGLFASLKKDELYTEWISSGAAQSTLLSIERNYLQEQQQRLLETRTMKEQLRADAKYGFMPTAFRGMRAFAEAFDEMVRIAEYTQAKKKTGSRLEAALRSRDVDIDFSRFGAKGVRQFNRISLFFNVALQGPEKIYRTFKENPKQTMMRGFMFLTLPTLALLAMNWDNEDYWELPQYERDMFWLFPTGNGKFFRVPIPFEWGILFKTMPERAFIWMKQKDPEVKEFLDRIWEYTVPSVMPTFIMPFIEWMTEKRLGLWYDIIPAREKSLPPEMQYGPGTSEVSKGIGKLFEVSPRKIDNLIRGTTGQLGDIALQTIDDITEIVGIRPESPADKKGVWGKTFTTSPFEKSSYHTEKFYKKLNKLEMEHKRGGVKGEPSKELQTLRKASKLMSDMRRLREETLKSKDYTAEQKADAVKKLNTAATDLARVAMGKDPIEEENLRVVINALR
ncbi:LPD38 domain-containing protein [Aneurinibacillus migulanus]|uniref:LPD38 domain-containing protein n=1 Tax=Aneurinibacillus migulanus TaxID=47500 RepID=UPI00209E96FB|nr:LPD38 domain-containing protein [Aneurinibacillus migulanus]MCP1357404.1 methyltransferase [Aneurinibacillus migulanus]